MLEWFFDGNKVRSSGAEFLLPIALLRRFGVCAPGLVYAAFLLCTRYTFDLGW